MIFQGEWAFDWSGWAFTGGQDVDGDGRDDLLFGAYGNNDTAGDAGKAYLFYATSIPQSGTLWLGDADVQLPGVAAFDLAGYWVDLLPDVEGDGGAEIVVGAMAAGANGFESGSAYVVFSSTIGAGGVFPLASADLTLHGLATEDQAGRYVASAGDVDNDGLGDLLVGARFADAPQIDSGEAYLLLGSTIAAGGATLASADVRFTATAEAQRVGGSVASAGDVDGDGLDDVLIGAFGVDEGGEFAGEAFLFLGSTLANASVLSIDAADAGFIGEEAGDTIGALLRPGGDFDGDGLDDLILGAWGRWSPLAEAGRTYILPSPF